MAIELKKKNFAKSSLASGITAGATQLTVASGEGSKFPSSGPFRAVLWSSAYSNPSDDPNAEVVEAELNASDTFDITRGKEGTSGYAWSSGDNFVHTITAETIEEIGQVVQTVHYQTGASTTGDTPLPSSDSIPQNDEGDEYMSTSITPKDANNKLLIEVVWIGGHSSSTPYMIAALFKDSDANAIAVSYGGTDGSGNTPSQICFRHEMTAGTTSAITFKVRAGNHNTGTTTFNGVAGSRRFGGVMASSLRITEYKA